MPEIYEQQVKAIRRRASVVKVLWIAFVPLIVLSGLLSVFWWDTYRPVIAIFFLYVGLFLYMGFRVHRFPCPKCGTQINTGRRSFWIPKTRFCEACGLEID